jgi:hypothetical protein
MFIKILRFYKKKWWKLLQKSILDGDMSGPGYRKLKSPPYEKRFRCVILFFSNNHLCNYTKTIIRLRLGEYRWIKTSTSSRFLFSDSFTSPWLQRIIVNYSNFQFTLLFESWVGNFRKTLLLVSRAKIQYARDGKRPDLSMLLFTNIGNELYCYSNEFPNHLFY